MDDARIDRRRHSLLVAPPQNLAEPPHLETFERISGEESPEREGSRYREEERPRRPEPDLFAGVGGPGRTARRHFFSAPSLETIRTPGRSGEKFAARANCRQGKAAPRNTPPTSGSLAGAWLELLLSAAIRPMSSLSLPVWRARTRSSTFGFCIASTSFLASAISLESGARNRT